MIEQRRGGAPPPGAAGAAPPGARAAPAARRRRRRAARRRRSRGAGRAGARSGADRRRRRAAAGATPRTGRGRARAVGRAAGGPVRLPGSHGADRARPAGRGRRGRGGGRRRRSGDRLGPPARRADRRRRPRPAPCRRRPAAAPRRRCRRPAPPPEPAPAGAAAAGGPGGSGCRTTCGARPVVAGDLLYVTSFEVHALDVASGRRQFKTRDVAWAMAVAGGRIHASDGPTPVRAGRDGRHRALAAARPTAGSTPSRSTAAPSSPAPAAAASRRGRPPAARSCGRLPGAQTDFETPEAGPAIHDGTVYVWQDARLRALEARTGAERWSYPVGDAASCGGVPVRVTPGARRHRRTSRPAPGCCAIDIATRPGALALRGARRLPLRRRPSRRARRSRAAASTSPTTSARCTPSTPRPARTAGASPPRRGSPIEPVLVADGNVHLGSGSALYTLDAVTGTPKWRFAAGGEVVGAPVVADGRVHFGSADHCLYTLDAAGGQLRWKLATGGEITGSPVARAGWSTRAARTAACTRWTRSRARPPAGAVRAAHARACPASPDGRNAACPAGAPMATGTVRA